MEAFSQNGRSPEMGGNLRAVFVYQAIELRPKHFSEMSCLNVSM